MNEVKQIMIKEFKIMKLGYDFMGYKVVRRNDLSFHHMIISHKECKERVLGEGVWFWNGAILVQKTSHDYLHLIEAKDEEIFALITSEMIDENIKGHLDLDNIRRIKDLLLYFEREHDHDRSAKGKILIKREYKIDRL